MQRLKIYTNAAGEAAFGGLTPEALNLVGEEVAGQASVTIHEAPVDRRSCPSDHRELIIMLSGVHEYSTQSDARRLFPGDVIVIDGADGSEHAFCTVGKEMAVALHFPLSPAEA